MNLKKSNWKKTPDIFRWRGVAGFKVPTDIFEWLKNACEKARQKKKTTDPYLVGYIKEEYDINEVSPKFEKFLLKCVDSVEFENYRKSLTYLSENRPLYVHELWVNYTRKHEFFPPHKHSGVFSFIIFVKIPYDLKEEENYFVSTGLKAYGPGFYYTSKLAFHNTSANGEITCELVDVDKEFESKIIMFPAAQVHQVFPFFTSDGYRIVVSGNLRLKV